MEFFKKKRNIVIVGVIAVVIIAMFIVPRIFGQSGDKGLVTNFTTLEKGELVSSINVKGTVKSEDSQTIYATNGFQITKVNVEVGDKVTAGQQLMELDTDELQSSIKESKARLNKQSQSALVQLDNAQRQYNEARQNLSSGQDGNLVAAKSNVETAKNALDNAKKNYDDKIKEHGEKDNAQLINAESAIRNAEIDLEKREEDFEKSKILFDSGAISQNEYEQAEQALTATRNALEDAKKSLSNIETGMDSELKALKQGLESAQLGYDKAVESLKSAELGLSQGVDQYRDGVKSAEVSVNTDSDLISIKNMEDRLEKSNITSPINGTITAVFAKEGASASGIMFVVEDTENLRIDTKIKEFDSTKVKEGMEVVIKSDATGEDIYEGKINKIAPTSIKDQTGQTAQTSDVEFETEVKVLSEKTDLKIGLNAKLTIILEKKESVLYAPFDALAEDEEGNDLIFILEKSSSGEYKAKKVPVNIIMETDFYAQIEGDGIVEGVRIVNNSLGIEDGMTIRIDETEDSN